jgi:hypothetical protein
MLKQESVKTPVVEEDEFPVLIAYDVEPVIQTEDDGIPVLIAYDLDPTPDPSLIICTHCEYVYHDIDDVSESTVCPNCGHLVLPLEGKIKTTMNFPLVYNSLTFQYIDFIE